MTLLAPQTLHRHKLRDQLVEQICELIATKEVVPGQVLPTEKELQQTYGVSHGVVREAVGILESRGLVEVRHGIGTFVNPPEAWDIAGPVGFFVHSDRAALLNWLEVRIALEAEAAALAADRADVQDVALIQAASERAAALAADSREFISADIAFHIQIARAAGNPSMVKIITPILEPLERSLVETARLPHSTDTAIAEHQSIYLAIASHDQESARQSMRRHLLRVQEEIQQLNLR